MNKVVQMLLHLKTYI